MVYKVYANPGPIVEKATPADDLAGALDFARCLSLSDLGAYSWTVRDLAGRAFGTYKAGTLVE